MARRLSSAIGRTFFVGGLGTVVFYGHTPTGWPLFKRADDPAHFGKLVAQGDRGDALNAAVAAYLGKPEPKPLAQKEPAK